MSKKPTHGDYTVGWICPLEVEQIAALEMLDEEHERLPQPSTDHNVYNLGSIVGHNVVIAGLYQPGNSPAATVVTQMRTTFPNLRFGMLVGIGGGVPVKTDHGSIRLGDVVVSKPVGSNSGTLQYDHGKAKAGLFERTGALAPPPAVLLNAAQDLQAKRARSRHDPLEKNLKRIDTSVPGLQRYKHPGAAHDCLYASDYIHKKPGESCADCGCDPSRRIQETVDDGDDGDAPFIVVHRGTIASGELVIKDAMLRDTLANEHGVLCFETEAAGSLADFPCIVIRGISDYCDSHKNDLWHGYAAVAAAAYARQLFFHIPIKETKRYISETAETDIRYLKKQQDTKARQRILDWLTPVDYGAQQSDYMRMRAPASGKWLLESAEYQAWLKADKQTLICPGIPGAGKTILTAVVVDDLTERVNSDPAIGMAYIYCNFRQQAMQSIDDLMTSLVKQLTQCQALLPKSVEYLYEKHQKKRTRPSLDEILDLLQNVVKMYTRLFIVVDALDECRVSDDTRARLLSELFSLQTLHGVNIFATSRNIPQIIDQFYGSISVEIRAHDEDVLQYLNGRIAQSESKVLRTCSEEIKSGITNVIDGMFLLAQLHFDSIKTKVTAKKVKEALRNLPRGSHAYSDVYKNAMERIKTQDTDSWELAKNVLSWIIHAKRPLKIGELQHALAVEDGEPELDAENIPHIEDMISVCAGLVIVDEESEIVRLVHYTTQEYFERAWTLWFPSAQIDITRTCITYLSLKTFEAGLCSSTEDFQLSNIFYDYVARHWGHHAYVASIGVEDMIFKFLQNDAQVSSAVQAMLFNEGSPKNVPKGISGLHLAAWFGLTRILSGFLRNGYDPDIKDSGKRTPLSYAARNGHEKAVQLLLNRGADIHAKGNGPGGGGGDHYWSYSDQTPLMYAARNGEVAVVRLLLFSGADVSAKGFSDRDSDDHTYGQTALMYAVRNGHEAVVRVLLSSGADVNAGEGCHNGDGIWFYEYKERTALMHAAMKGHETIVQLLIIGGADVNAEEAGGSNGSGCYDDEYPRYYHRTALMYAARNGHEKVAQLLLCNGADVNAAECGSRNVHRNTNRFPFYDGLTALMYAAKNGHEMMVRLLLSHGAEVNERETGHKCHDSYDFDGRTALMYAAIGGHENVVQLLLDGGADANAKEKGYYDYGFNDTDEDGDDNDNDDCGRTALTYAIMNGQEAVVRLLLTANKADINTKDCAGRTPLWYATDKGQETMMRLLLENGAIRT